MSLEETTKGSWTKYAADTVAAQSWGLTVGTLTEIAAGMSAEQIAKSRGMMIVMNAVVGRPYGLWRDFVLRTYGVTEETGKLARAAIEGVATASFYTTLYVSLNAAFNDTDGKTLAMSAVSGVAMGLALGRPYGWYLDKVRDWFGVSPEYIKKSE